MLFGPNKNEIMGGVYGKMDGLKNIQVYSIQSSPLSIKPKSIHIYYVIVDYGEILPRYKCGYSHSTYFKIPK